MFKTLSFLPVLLSICVAQCAGWQQIAIPCGPVVEHQTKLACTPDGNCALFARNPKQDPLLVVSTDRGATWNHAALKWTGISIADEVSVAWEDNSLVLAVVKPGRVRILSSADLGQSWVALVEDIYHVWAANATLKEQPGSPSVQHAALTCNGPRCELAVVSASGDIRWWASKAGQWHEEPAPRGGRKGTQAGDYKPEGDFPVASVLVAVSADGTVAALITRTVGNPALYVCEAISDAAEMRRRHCVWHRQYSLPRGRWSGLVPVSTGTWAAVSDDITLGYKGLVGYLLHQGGFYGSPALAEKHISRLALVGQARNGADGPALHAVRLEKSALHWTSSGAKLTMNIFSGEGLVPFPRSDGCTAAERPNRLVGAVIFGSGERLAVLRVAACDCLFALTTPLPLASNSYSDTQHDAKEIIEVVPLKTLTPSCSML